MVQSFWKDVSKCIKKCTLISIPLMVDVCILGLVHLLVMSRAMRTLIGLLLFYAKKAILFNCKSPMVSRLDFWKTLINSAIPLYKFTYESRGCPGKVAKTHTWDMWVDSLATNHSEATSKRFALPPWLYSIDPMRAPAEYRRIGWCHLWICLCQWALSKSNILVAKWIYQHCFCVVFFLSFAFCVFYVCLLQ